VETGERLFFGIAEQGLRPLVEQDQPALHVGGDDAVDRRIDQVVEEGVAPPQFRLQFFPCRDIDQIEKIVIRSGRGIDQNDVDLGVLSVFPLDLDLVPEL